MEVLNKIWFSFIDGDLFRFDAEEWYYMDIYIDKFAIIKSNNTRMTALMKLIYTTGWPLSTFH